MPATDSIAQSDAWRALSEHRGQFTGQTLSQLFAADPLRAQRFSASAAGIHLDYSKQHVTETTLHLLLQLAETARLGGQIEALFAGACVNRSENRPALHAALRDAPTNPGVAGRFRQQREHMLALAADLRAGVLTGAGGLACTDLVHLGIGGSDLGPRLAVSAFPHLDSGPVRVHFAANLDADALAGALAECRPDTTLFALASKSFSTLETLSNAGLARQWLRAGGIAEADLERHWIAITSRPERARTWGVAAERILEFDEGVGGRYSLWSAIGLPVAVALGPESFTGLLAGARAMDEHFRTADPQHNLPILMGLLRIWQVNFWGHATQAVLPYAHALRLLPDYLQQLVMESLGKRVDQQGQELSYATGAVLWGSEETNGQHSFHQLLLQGTQVVPVDFVTTARAHCAADQHRQLYANCLAQSRALMAGRSAGELEAELLATGEPRERARALAAQRAVPGNRPSSTLVLESLEPRHLGALLALYEHSVFVQSAIWGINAFDQWGVELGKQAAAAIDAALTGGDAGDLDASTRALAEIWQSANAEPR